MHTFVFLFQFQPEVFVCVCVCVLTLIKHPPPPPLPPLRPGPADVRKLCPSVPARVLRRRDVSPVDQKLYVAGGGPGRDGEGRGVGVGGEVQGRVRFEVDPCRAGCVEYGEFGGEYKRISVLHHLPVLQGESLTV